MRVARITWGILAALGLVHGGAAATLVPRQASEPTTSGNTASTTAQAAPVDPQVAFLQTLQAAQVSSMSCLITLVNMTVTPIGTCLGLTTLADLIARPADNSSFSTQLTGYLSTVCASGQCTDGDISQTRAQLADTCASSGDTQLVTVLRAILDNYTNSYRTLACSVYFNGTGDPCLPANLNTSDAASNNGFFNNLVTGTDLQQYQQSVFEQAACTGCMYELYKAAVYMIPDIRGNGVTTAFGAHLQTCGQEAGQDWSNVQDQQIPDSLMIQQSTGRPAGAGARRAVLGMGYGLMGWEVAIAVAILGGWTVLDRECEAKSQ